MSKTVQDITRAVARRFRAAKLVYGHGALDAGEEAAFIVFEALGLPHAARFLKKKLNPAQERKIESLVEARIKTRRPAAYLLNKSYLQGIPFYVDERVIIPRSFIAELLAGEFPLIDDFDEIKSVLDLCTGSGCLAVIAAHAFPNARIDAVELSKDAADVAARNIKESGFAKRITLKRGDLFAPVKGKTYDLIITNPPYVAPPSMKKLPREYRHEPRLALAGPGSDGLDLVRKILKKAPAHLKKGGAILCEIGAGRKALEKSTPDLPYLWLDTEMSAGEVFWLSREDLKKRPGKGRS